MSSNKASTSKDATDHTLRHHETLARAAELIRNSFPEDSDGREYCWVCNGLVPWRCSSYDEIEGCGWSGQDIDDDDKCPCCGGDIEPDYGESPDHTDNCDLARTLRGLEYLEFGVRAVHRTYICEVVDRLNERAESRRVLQKKAAPGFETRIQSEIAQALEDEADRLDRLQIPVHLKTPEHALKARVKELESRLENMRSPASMSTELVAVNRALDGCGVPTVATTPLTPPVQPTIDRINNFAELMKVGYKNLHAIMNREGSWTGPRTTEQSVYDRLTQLVNRLIRLRENNASPTHVISDATGADHALEARVEELESRLNSIVEKHNADDARKQRVQMIERLVKQAEEDRLDTLQLNDLTLDADAARALAGWGQGDSGRRTLYLDRVTALDAATARALAGWGQGDSGRRTLYLDGLRSLDEPAALALGAWGRDEPGTRTLFIRGITPLDGCGCAAAAMRQFAARSNCTLEGFAVQSTPER